MNYFLPQMGIRANVISLLTVKVQIEIARILISSTG